MLIVPSLEQVVGVNARFPKHDLTHRHGHACGINVPPVGIHPDIARAREKLRNRIASRLSGIAVAPTSSWCLWNMLGWPRQIPLTPQSCADP